jgi:hypothetical protein
MFVSSEEGVGNFSVSDPRVITIITLVRSIRFRGWFLKLERLKAAASDKLNYLLSFSLSMPSPPQEV